MYSSLPNDRTQKRILTYDSSLSFFKCSFLAHLFLLLIAARLVRPHG
jgi:hypothetical protein